MPLEATFLPDSGMNMASYKLGDIEVIDQSTRNLFEERFAGLGALIGPHFHRRKKETLPKIKDESLFPHIARVKAKGVDDPFSHGIGRYAPWKAESDVSKIKAELSGKDVWNGVPVSALEGQNFKMVYAAELLPTGLQIDISVVSDADSLVGLHYYYYLPQGQGTVYSRVQDCILDNGETRPIPRDWKYDADQKHLQLSLDRAYDNTFYPFPDTLEAQIMLDAGSYRLFVSYTCASQENAWQLYHPAGASFVCIEPLSAQDPRHPNLTVSSLRVHLQIQAGKSV